MESLGFRFKGLRIQGLDFGEFRVQGLGSGLWGSGFRLQRVQGVGGSGFGL